MLRLAATICATVLALAGLWAASAVMTPVAFALFIIALVWPLQRRLQVVLPQVVAVLVTSAVALLAIGSGGWLVVWGFGGIAQWVIANAARLQGLYLHAAVLRGERGHCSMARVPTIAEEDAKRPNRERECLVGERTRIVNRMKATLARLGVRNFKPTLRKAAERLAMVHTPEGTPLPRNVLAELQRDMARLGFVVSQIREIEQARQKRLEQETETGPHAMVRQVARVIGIGIETADMLVHEVLSRPMRDRKAVARYAGLTGSPDESGARRREQGLARAGNARVRRGMIQLAWRFLRFQRQSTLALWYRARTADSRSGTRKTIRKLVIALWRFVTTGEPLEGVVLRPAA